MFFFVLLLGEKGQNFSSFSLKKESWVSFQSKIR